MTVVSSDLHIAGTLALLVLALVLFMRESRIPLETSSLVVLTLLLAGFYFFPFSTPTGTASPWIFLDGFGNEALITIVALVICARALETTGALWPVAHFLSAGFTRSPTLALLATLVSAATISMFINNTPLVAILIPILISVCLRTHQDASRILMPAGFASIIGGMCTTIGTSTNLLVIDIASDLGMRRVGLFDFTGMALTAAIPGLLFLWLIAPRLLPRREAPISGPGPRRFRAVLRVLPDGFAAGKTLQQLSKRTMKSLRIEAVERKAGVFLVRLPSLRLQADDRLHVTDTPDRLREYERLLGVAMTENAPGAKKGALAELHMAELLVSRDSPLKNRDLKSTERLLEEYNLACLAVHTAKSEKGGRHFAQTKLQAADILLVQGTRRDIDRFRRTTGILVLDGSASVPYTRMAPLALAVMALIVVFAAFGLMPITLAAVCGAAVLLLTRCLSWDQAVQAIDRRLVLVIVTSLALGQALTLTGATDVLAGLLADGLRDLPPALVISALLLATALITEIVTNNAAAVLATPIAFSLAGQLGMDPEPLVFAVLFGANMSYITPIGYQTNLLVFTAGGYRFSDFLRVGIPLQVLLWASFSAVLISAYVPGGLWNG